MCENLRFCESNIRAGNKTSKIMLHVLKHKVQPTNHPRCSKPLQFDDIGVIKPAEDENLPCHELHALRLPSFELYLLHCHNLSRQYILCLVYMAICPLPNLHNTINPLNLSNSKQETFFF